MPHFPTTTHFAGLPIIIEGRCIQRCGWCGYKLVDKMIADPYKPGGKELVDELYMPGSIVRVDDDNGEQFLVTTKDWGTGVPLDACDKLIE